MSKLTDNLTEKHFRRYTKPSPEYPNGYYEVTLAASIRIPIPEYNPDHDIGIEGFLREELNEEVYGDVLSKLAELTEDIHDLLGAVPIEDYTKVKYVLNKLQDITKDLNP